MIYKKYYLLLSAMLLSSCGSGEITSFKEKDNYVFDASTYVNYFKNAKKMILSSYQEPEFADSSFRKSIDPLNSDSTFSFIKEELYEGTQLYTSLLFREFEGYEVHSGYNFITKLYVSYNNIEDGLKFGRMQESKSEQMPFNASVSSITNGNVNAYHILLDVHDDDDGTNNYDVVHDVLYLLYKVNNRQYEVYFNTNNLFLMPKDEKFSKKYIEYFMKDQSIHYFDFEEVDSYAKENSITIE